ncbi:MAG: hypothetical protein Q9211_003505 [Gyalolechia sp. 1 TL-2023]
MAADNDEAKARHVPQEKATAALSSDSGPPASRPSQPATAKPPYSALSLGRRRFMLGIVTATGFFGPLAGGIYLPVLPTLQHVFNASATTINATVSVFMAISSLAPLFWGSLADYGGHKPLYMVSLAIYIASNIFMAAIPANLPAIFIVRVVQDVGAAAGLSLGAGTVADITESKDRASAINIGGLAWATVRSRAGAGPWWCHHRKGQLAVDLGFLAITCLVVYILVVFCLPETRRSIVGKASCYAKRESRWCKRSHIAEGRPDERHGPVRRIRHGRQQDEGGLQSKIGGEDMLLKGGEGGDGERMVGYLSHDEALEGKGRD